MAQLEYNGYTITGVDGEFGWSFQGQNYTFTQVFAIYADTYALQKVAVDAMYEKLNQPFGDLKVTIGGTVFFETNQANHTGGFNCIPVVKKIDDDSSGTFAKYIFSVDVELPANVLGAAPFATGLASINCSTSEETSVVRLISFTGMWKVIAGVATDAKARYKDNIETAIETYYLTPYFTGNYDIMSNSYEFDMKNKVVNFSIVYREIIFAYPTATPYYALKNLNIEKIENESIGVRPDIQSSLVTGGKHDVSGEATLNKYIPPIRYSISGDLAFYKSVAVGSSVIAKYKSEVNAWLIKFIKNIFTTKTLLVTDITLKYDHVMNGLNFRIDAMTLKNNIAIFEMTVNDTISENYNLTPIATSEDYANMVHTTGKGRMMNIQINVTMVDKKPTTNFFDSLIPVGINPAASKANGWLYTDRTETKTYKKKADKANLNGKYNTYYTKSMFYSATWVEVKVPAKVDMTITGRTSQGGK